jgi:hypothetical protein
MLDIEVHTAELLVPGPSRLEVEIAIANLKKSAIESRYQARAASEDMTVDTSLCVCACISEL